MSTASLISSCCNCRREWKIEQEDDDDGAAVEGPEDGAAAVWSVVGITVGSAVGASIESLEGTTVGMNVGLIVG